MSTLPTNVCIRCGKTRIVTKTWKEGEITYSYFSCPDSACQEIVELELKKKQDRLQTIQAHSLKRRTEQMRKKRR